MLYPLYVYQEDGSAYGMTFPDIPGCFAAAADSAEGIAAAAQEAFEAHFHADDHDAIPPPSNLAELMLSPTYVSGSWMQVDIDFSPVLKQNLRRKI